MPSVALVDGKLHHALHIEEADARVADLVCPDCSDVLSYTTSHTRERASGTVFVTEHFSHRGGRPEGCNAGGGGGGPAEGDRHKRWKAIVRSYLTDRFPDATVVNEDDDGARPMVGSRFPDLLVTFETPVAPWGRGIAVEVQDKNKGKDLAGTEHDYVREGYSTMWAEAEHFDGDNLLPPLDEVPLWPNGVSPSDEWEMTDVSVGVGVSSGTFSKEEEFDIIGAYDVLSDAERAEIYEDMTYLAYHERDCWTLVNATDLTMDEALDRTPSGTVTRSLERPVVEVNVKFPPEYLEQHRDELRESWVAGPDLTEVPPSDEWGSGTDDVDANDGELVGEINVELPPEYLEQHRDEFREAWVAGPDLTEVPSPDNWGGRNREADDYLFDAHLTDEFHPFHVEINVELPPAYLEQQRKSLRGAWRVGTHHRRNEERRTLATDALDDYPRPSRSLTSSNAPRTCEKCGDDASHYVAGDGSHLFCPRHVLLFLATETAVDGDD